MPVGKEFLLSPRTLEALEWDRIIEELERRCASQPGCHAARRLSPMGVESARLRMRRTGEIRELATKNEEMSFTGVTDITQALDFAVKGGLLKPAELVAVRSLVLASHGVRSFLKTHREEYPALGQMAASLADLDEIGKTLFGSITDAGELSESAFPALRRIKSDLRAARGDIEKKLHELIYSPSYGKYLQEKIFTTRNERYVVLLKASFRGKIRGTVHDVSASESTLYLEPDSVSDLNDRLIMLGVELQEEVARILAALSRAVAAHAPALRGNLDVIADLDCLNASARLSAALRAAEPAVTQDGALRLYAARHPLLSLMMGDGVVPNDIMLGDDYRCLIISGANTGGKTVVLKTAGLVALMALHGLHVPAGPDSSVSLFSGIFADIGDDQNLSQSLSTYSGQIVTVREMIEHAGESTLLLIDEIVVGTNPRQGAALAQAILEALADTGARMMVTTHYSELKELAGADGRFRNASVAFDTATLKPAYRLIPGIPGGSYALEIARLYGIRDSIIDRAKSLLDGRELSVETLIEKMRLVEDELFNERRAMESMKAELAAEKDRCRIELAGIRKKEEELKRREGVEFLDEIRKMRERAAARIRELQQSDIREAGAVRSELAEIETSVADELRKNRSGRYSEGYRAFDPALAAPGDAVLVLPLERSGSIDSIDPDGRTALVLLGSSMKSRFAFNDLLVPLKQAQPSGKRQTKHSPSPEDSRPAPVALTIQTSYNTVDLRGRRVDEALSELELALDRMVRGGVRSAVVIHGHGTGALKEAVRNWLGFSSYVLEFRPGEHGEGGDGVSIAVLRD